MTKEEEEARLAKLSRAQPPRPVVPTSRPLAPPQAACPAPPAPKPAVPPLPSPGRRGDRRAGPATRLREARPPRPCGRRPKRQAARAAPKRAAAKRAGAGKRKVRAPATPRSARSARRRRPGPAPSGPPAGRAGRSAGKGRSHDRKGPDQALHAEPIANRPPAPRPRRAGAGPRSGAGLPPRRRGRPGGRQPGGRGAGDVRLGPGPGGPRLRRPGRPGPPRRPRSPPTAAPWRSARGTRRPRCASRGRRPSGRCPRRSRARREGGLAGLGAGGGARTPAARARLRRGHRPGRRSRPRPRPP